VLASAYAEEIYSVEFEYRNNFIMTKLSSTLLDERYFSVTTDKRISRRLGSHHETKNQTNRLILSNCIYFQNVESYITISPLLHPLVLRLAVYHEQCVGFELIKHHLKLSTNLIVVLLRLYICFSSKRDSITSPSNALTKSRPRTIFATFAAL